MGRNRVHLTKSEAINFVTEKVDPSGVDSHRRPWEIQWLKNAAFLNGKQHYITDGYRLRDPILPKHKVLYRANIIRSAVTRAVASVMATKATFKAIPDEDTKRSRDASFVTEKLFEHARKALRWEEVVEQMLHWSACLGNGILQLSWDPDKGVPERFYLESKKSRKAVVGLTEEEKREKEEKGLFEDHAPGEVSIEALSMFEFHWDYRAREEGLSGARWAARRRLIDIEVLEDIYGYEATKHVKPNDIHGEGSYFEELISFMSSGFRSPLTGYVVPKEKRQQQTILIHLYEKPLRANGNVGREIVIAGEDVVLKNQPNPYRATGFSLPFLDFPWLIRPGAFVGHSLVEMLLSPQFQYNAARAKMVEHQNVYGAPSLFVPKGSNIRTGSLSIQPGLIHEYTPTPGLAKPFETGPVPTLSKEVAQNAQLSLQEMNVISSQTDPDMSKLPGQIRGGPAMQMMLEEKNKVLQPTAARLVRLTEEAGRRILRMQKTHYTGQRKLAYVGEDNQFRLVEFEAADINTDLRLVGEPSYFHSAATERAKVMEMVQVGILDPVNNPQDKIDVLKAMAFSTPKELISERLADEDNQEQEIQEVIANPLDFIAIGEGGDVRPTLVVNPWDNDAIHVRVLERLFKRRLEWNGLPNLVHQILLQHYAEHRQRLEARAKAALEQQAALKGTPGQKGRASQPASVA